MKSEMILNKNIFARIFLRVGIIDGRNLIQLVLNIFTYQVY